MPLDPRTYAVIDLGSNSFRLLTAKAVDNTSFDILDDQQQTVRLASGLKGNGLLNDDAMQRGWQCLQEFQQQIAALPRRQLRVIGTQALRQACNSDIFLQKAKNILRLEHIDVISGEQEGRLIYQGVHAQLPIDNPASNDLKLIIDIGGASSECIVGNGTTVLKSLSIPLGCVTYQRYFPNGAINAQHWQAAKQACAKQSAPYLRQLTEILQKHKTQNLQIVGTSGVFEALADIEPKYSKQLSHAHLIALQDQLLTWGHHQKITWPTLKPDKREICAPGLAIAQQLLESIDAQTIDIARTSLRHGIMANLIKHGQSELS